MRKELLISILLGVIGIGVVVYFLLREPASTVIVPSDVKTALSKADVAKHATESDCWVIVNNNIYNVTNYIPNHPAGPQTIIPLCGADATEAFNTRNGKGPHLPKANQQLESMLVGAIE